MDLKYLLCEPISKFAVKAEQRNVDWHANNNATTIYPTTKGQDWIMNSPKSMCSSVSTCSSTSTNSGDEYSNHPTKSSVTRRRTESDVSLTRHHMFIYSHPNRRPRSESAGNNNNVQTRTPWTPFEDHLLQQGYDQGLSWAMISSTYLPHRSRGCCWGRFKTLQNKNMVDPTHSHMRHFRRPWKAIDFNNKKLSL
ncbi:uncharacterized protein EV154DRAFT_459694 [Mucor mucedo]|uniref:Myb-like domain-containing protein n=1 Tax=Mucor saturninus TaxID=64648 RepID=A0A8H7RFA0_9FUNG|nr:uncharacterized protein EV154DRAFT_459694 [Mucor mucedo]KAG2208648.1 hypothetical protein INT47_007746 [Mucor saturninus]KAI7894293.1 hypothetical protein EV154DRAFT_459694 [Mucor mucedo]